MTENIGEEATVSRKRQKAVTQANVDESILRDLMGSKLGRDHIWRRLEASNIFSSTIRFGDDGYAKTAFLEGQRSLGIDLLAQIMRTAPSQFVLMLNEHNPKLETENGRPDPDSGSSPDPSASAGSPDA